MNDTTTTWRGQMFANFYLDTQGKYTGPEMAGFPYRRGQLVPIKDRDYAMQRHNECCAFVREALGASA